MSDFIGFKDWLNERAAEKLHYGCVMLEANVPNWKEKISVVDKENVYEKDDDFGYEKTPHVTIVYGFHEEEIDREKVYEDIKEMKPISVTIDSISMFECDDYDVVKYEVPITKELKAYRKTLLKHPNTQTHKQYKPHMTIAYVKKGEGKKYVQKVKPFKVKFDKVCYSSPNYDKKYFDLK